MKSTGLTQENGCSLPWNSPWRKLRVSSSWKHWFLWRIRYVTSMGCFFQICKRYSTLGLTVKATKCLVSTHTLLHYSRCSHLPPDKLRHSNTINQLDSSWDGTVYGAASFLCSVLKVCLVKNLLSELAFTFAWGALDNHKQHRPIIPSYIRGNWYVFGLM